MGLLAGATSKIALGISSIILPLRHPANVAKAAATVDQFSNGRFILGVASGDRPEEYPAMNISYAQRGESFRESFRYIRQMSERFPVFDSAHGSLHGTVDMVPKPVGSQIPLIVTGGSQQQLDWIAQHGDGWMIYPRAVPI